MSNPIQFTSATPRLGMPLLFVGQTQKEFFVNEAHALIDGLMHCAIEGSLQSPPASPSNGQAWLVDTSATGGWDGHDGDLALYQGGNWHFATPSEGMTIYDKAAGQFARFAGDWRKGSPVTLPQGGTTADTQARAAIGDLVAALVEAGILPDT